MPTVLDQETVFTEYQTSVPADISAPLRPHIAGPYAELRRFTASASEKALGALGEYDPEEATTYDWPNKTVGSIVDLDYVKVYIDDALLEYHQDLKSVGDVIAPVSGYKNRLATDGARGFAANGEDYPRITALKDRDVAVGDVLFLQDGSDTQWNVVHGLVADEVGAVIAAATADAANDVSRPNNLPGSAPTVSVTGGGASGGSLVAGTYFVRYSFAGPFGETWASAAQTFTSASGNIPRVTIPSLPTGATSAKIYLSPVGGTALQCTLYASGITGTTHDLSSAYATGGAAYIPDIEKTVGAANGVTVTAVDASTYSGSDTGDLTETYTITVTQASTGGDLTTALLSVTSASGRDDVASVAPAASASPTTIGANGLTVTFTRTADDLVVGHTWRITAGQAFVAPTATSAGTFTGSADVTYVVTVSRGGTYAGATKPQITATAADGTDSSGPTNVTAADGAVSIGTLGVTIAFNQTQLNKGDIYYVAVTGPTAGAYKTIVLANNLTTALQASTDMDVTFYLKKDMEVTRNRVDDPPNVNWTADADGLTLEDGITAYDDSLTDDGVAFAVPVKGGTVHAHYRAWLDAYSREISEVSTPAEAEALFGEVACESADSVLPYAVYKAALNSNGTAVKFTAVSDPTDADEWAEVLAQLEGLDDVFSLVPLTRDADVIEQYRDHIVARSDDAERSGEWRHGWFNLEASDAIALVDEEIAGGVVQAVLSDNPGVSGTQYTQLACTTDNSLFVTRGVAAGDVVRYVYGIDSFGEPSYQSFTVRSVVNEDTLILESGHSAAVSTAQRVEVWRTLTKTQIANDLVSALPGTANKRFKYVWPDRITDDLGAEVEGFHLCAAYAGFIGGIAPHQGLRNVQIKGFSATPRSTSFFNNAQLNVLGAGGFFVVTTNPTDGRVYARFARTTDDSTTAAREEATARLDDAIRYLFYNRVASFFGKANTAEAALALIGVELKSAAQHAMSDTKIDRIGTMILAADVSPPRLHLTQEDKIVADVTVTRGFPINETTMQIVFS